MTRPWAETDKYSDHERSTYIPAPSMYSMHRLLPYLCSAKQRQIKMHLALLS